MDGRTVTVARHEPDGVPAAPGHAGADGRAGGALASPTLWGLEPAQIHDRFWAARGVQVVRQGAAGEISEGSELFLLATAGELLLFKLGGLLDLLGWTRAELLMIKLQNRREGAYRERVLLSQEGSFQGFRRAYGGAEPRSIRLGLTSSPELARRWQAAPTPRQGWQRLRIDVPAGRRDAASADGRIYDRSNDQDVADFVQDLLSRWARPDAAIDGVRRLSSDVWAHEGSRVEPGARFFGPVWIGSGRAVAAGARLFGPAILWDDPSARPAVAGLRWADLEPTARQDRPARPTSALRVGRPGKRAFDIVASLAGLALTLPLYPAILLAIFLEDGRPFFFVHRRETVRGRPFPLFKFRSMSRDAEQRKAALSVENQVDGPQFFIENDPRLTRVGRLLRLSKLDELPQFLNVLLGHMSIVGPRPSPFEENQFCPAWREARLSVRPGITGLWQVKRTRRPGQDFQEWIRYDTEYVEKAGWRMDAWILWRTLFVILHWR